MSLHKGSTRLMSQWWWAQTSWERWWGQIVDCDCQRTPEWNITDSLKNSKQTGDLKWHSRVYNYNKSEREEKYRESELKINQLSDQEFFLNNIQRRRVLWVISLYSGMCTLTRYTVWCVQEGMQVPLCVWPLRHIGKYFVSIKIIFLEIQQMVLSMESISWKIFGDTCIIWTCQLNNISRRVWQVSLYGHFHSKTQDQRHREEQKTWILSSMDYEKV